MICFFTGICPSTLWFSRSTLWLEYFIGFLSPGNTASCLLPPYTLFSPFPHQIVWQPPPDLYTYKRLDLIFSIKMELQNWILWILKVFHGEKNGKSDRFWHLSCILSLKDLPEMMGCELKEKDIGLLTLTDTVLCTLASWTGFGIAILATNYTFHLCILDAKHRKMNDSCFFSRFLPVWQEQWTCIYLMKCKSSCI